jgi:hypothetical protein
MLLLTLAATALPAPAAQRITVVDLQQFLTAEYAAHTSDSSIAGHLGVMELSEQLTETTFDRITEELKPGKKTAQALQLMADQSAFLEPPAGEIPGKAMPGMAEQMRLIKGMVDFANVTIGRLPNFLATRTTHTFDDRVLYMTPDASRVDFVGGGTLETTGEYSRQITYRDGRELKVDDQGTQVNPDDGLPELTSTGEFGPFLQIVLGDSAKGRINWSHWEQMRSGTAAVFHYDVPQEASHYQFEFCCVLVVPQPDAASGKQATNSSGRLSTYHSTPGYHGFLYLDSETGAVLRVTLEADLPDNIPVTRAAVWVEYGAQTIGEHDYLCPVRSMALMELSASGQSHPGLIRLNEVAFTNYHRFGSTTRIVPDAPQ